MQNTRKNKPRSVDYLPILLLTLLFLVCILTYFIIREYRSSKNNNTETITSVKQSVSQSEAATGEKDETKDKITTKSSDIKSTGSTSKNQKVFEKSLFIGDSRTNGFSTLAGITTGTFYCDARLSIDKLDSLAFVDDDGKRKTVLDALKGKDFDKIFISLGLNELGWPMNSFITQYSDIVKKIQNLQPNAVIYIQSIIHVTKEKSESHEYFTNDNINKFNSSLKALANGQNIIYIDVNPSLTDANGNLIAASNNDGIHFAKHYYELWLQEIIDFLNSN